MIDGCLVGVWWLFGACLVDAWLLLGGGLVSVLVECWRWFLGRLYDV